MQSIEDAALVAYAPEANLLFIASKTYDRENRRNDTVVRALNATSFEEVGVVEIDADILGMATTPDGSVQALISRAEDSETETKENPPSSLRDLERDEFRHKNDAKTAKIFIVTQRGTKVDVMETWYSAFSQPTISIMSDGTVWIAPYSGRTAVFDPKSGEIALRDVGLGTLYGRKFSDDGSLMLAGSLSEVSMTKPGSNGLSLVVRLTKLPGWPEYVQRFAMAGDGGFYAGTTAFRVLRFDASGLMQVSAPLY